MRLSNVTIGRHRGPWRWEWRRPYEYWDRWRLGPLYVLWHRWRAYDDEAQGGQQ